MVPAIKKKDFLSSEFCGLEFKANYEDGSMKRVIALIFRADSSQGDPNIDLVPVTWHDGEWRDARTITGFLSLDPGAHEMSGLSSATLDDGNWFAEYELIDGTLEYRRIAAWCLGWKGSIHGMVSENHGAVDLVQANNFPGFTGYKLKKSAMGNSWGVHLTDELVNAKLEELGVKPSDVRSNVNNVFARNLFEVLGKNKLDRFEEETRP